MRKLCAWAVGLLFGLGSARAVEKPILVLDAGGHTAMVKKCLFTPDGKEVITVSEDKTIRVWDVATGETLRMLRLSIGDGPQGMLYTAALSPDGQTLAVGGYGSPANKWCEIYLIALATNRVKRVLTGHENVIQGLAFSADGNLLASGSGDTTTKVWRVATGDCLQTLTGHAKATYGVAFSPNGQAVATASNDGTAKLWSVTTGRCTATLAGHDKEVSCVDWSADGLTVATGSYDESIRLWNADGSLRQTVSKLGSHILSVQFQPDSRGLLLTRGVRTTSTAWDCSTLDLATGQEKTRFRLHNNSVMTGRLSRDGTLAVTAGGDDEDTYVWQTADGRELAHMVSKGRTPWSAAWSADGSTIAWGNRNENKSIEAKSPLQRAFRLTDLEFDTAPDDRFRRSKSTLGTLSLEKTARATAIVKQGTETRTTLKRDQEYDEIRCFTLLPNDRAALGANFGLSLYDTRSGEKLRDFVGHTGAVWAVAPSPDNRYLLSASYDQTLRIWTLDQDDPLLSLFFAGDEWVAWTPDSYYAASPGGEKLMGWHVNRGPDQLAEFHPAARFRKELYRPDVIKLLLRTGSVAGALAEADRVRGVATARTDVAQLLPPNVTITSPNGGKITAAAVTVTAQAESRGDHPVTAMSLLLDGQKLRDTRRFATPKLGVTTAEWPLTLEPGRHTLTVQAESAVSVGASDPVELVYSGSVPEIRLPRLIVLAVGVSDYQSPGLQKLDYAATDATAVVAAFDTHSKPLFREIKTKLLTDAKATRDDVLDGLDWVVKEASQDDYVVIFFAGHGERDGAGNFYCLPVDADKDKLRRSAVSGEELQKTFRGLPPSRRVLILDACHSGAVGDGKKRGDSLTDNVIRDLLASDNGVVVMCSSTGRELSQENRPHKKGVFTLALTEALAGRGAKDKDGLIFTHHLHSYVCDRVKELTRGEQHPVMKNPDEIRSFPLSKP